jgi:hypothetical protein
VQLAPGAHASQCDPERELCRDQQLWRRLSLWPAVCDPQPAAVGGDVEDHGADEWLEHGDALGRRVQVRTAERREEGRVERLDGQRVPDPRREVGIFCLGIDGCPEPVVLVGSHRDRTVREGARGQVGLAEHATE